ncbi:DnaJ-like protein 4 [Polychytrium aggregatum]|uniref:DnaJ-like protein 4 n=1 Tax=Polychytrium aggregatum TaxID=110093 RepID=UPI0022FDCC02|nr:DnaJ-like protein 4 [Polychytrium aggregatum]KAI9202099.1 DnaJ-like protein 4 [Polychytrium aggregatum]
MQSAEQVDYYAILGLSRSANPDEVKRAYRKEALRWHPDKNTDNRDEAEHRFKLISEAYEVLKDPEQRQMYDSYGIDGLKNGPASNQQQFGRGGFRPGFHPGFQFHDPHEIFRQFFGGVDPFARAFRDPFGRDPFGFDVFANDPFFSPGARPQQGGVPGQQRGVADPFAMHSPFGSLSMHQPFGGFVNGGNGGSSFMSFSSTSSSGGNNGAFMTSSSSSTTIVNGERRTVTTTTDSAGNQTVETLVQDRNGRVTREMVVNGVPQVLEDGGRSKSKAIRSQ